MNIFAYLQGDHLGHVVEGYIGYKKLIKEDTATVKVNDDDRF